jgi:predicted dehydrogenase
MPLTRREFSKLTAAILATRSIPSAFASAPDKKIGYCVVGLGRIADHYLRGCKNSPTSPITALVSGHRDKALRIARDYNIPESSVYSYEQYDRIRDNKSINAVIICLPNSMHAEYTIRAAKAGKHVLCEKPMSTSVKDAEAMIAACAAAQVKLMIAYRLHYEPTTLRAIQLLRSGTLGKLQSIVASNGFNIGPNEWRTDKVLGGGGPLMDVGIYCLNATRYLTGEEPTSFEAYSFTIDKGDPRFATVEENTSWMQRFPSGLVASCTTTYGAHMPGFYRVNGSRGWLQVDGYGYEGQQLTGSYVTEDSAAPPTTLDERSTRTDPSQFTAQVDHFSDCIVHNKAPRTAGQEGLLDMRHMRSIYKAAGIDNLA